MLLIIAIVISEQRYLSNSPAVLRSGCVRIESMRVISNMDIPCPVRQEYIYIVFHECTKTCQFDTTWVITGRRRVERGESTWKGKDFMDTKFKLSIMNASEHSRTGQDRRHWDQELKGRWDSESAVDSVLVVVKSESVANDLHHDSSGFTE